MLAVEQTSTAKISDVKDEVAQIEKLMAELVDTKDKFDKAHGTDLRKMTSG